MRVAVIRRAHFNAAHKLHIPTLSVEENLEKFGVCANPNFHGHNYDLEVSVIGDVDPVTGMVIDLKLLKDIIKEEVEDRFDHKNLNLDVEEFKEIQPTAENMAIVIYNIMKERLDDKYDIRIKLYETARNFVEYPVM